MKVSEGEYRVSVMDKVLEKGSPDWDSERGTEDGICVSSVWMCSSMLFRKVW